MSEEFATELDAVERSLRKSQKSGWAATGLYETDAVFSEAARFARPAIAVALVSGGTRAEIRATELGRTGEGRLVPRDASLVHGWPSAVSVMAAVPEDGAVVFYVRHQRSHADTMGRVRVACSGDSVTRCKAEPEVEFPLPRGTWSRGPSGAWLRTDGPGIEVYESDEALGRGAPSTKTTASFLPTSPLKLASLDDKDRALACAICGPRLFPIEVATPAGSRASSLALPGADDLRLAGLGSRGDRLGLLVNRDSGLELWDCPLTVLDPAAGAGVTCAVSAAPREMNSSIALVAGDLTALDAPFVGPAPANCGREVWEIRSGGWVWLLDRAAQRQWAAPAHGIALCSPDGIVTYRAGRLDQFDLAWTPQVSRIEPLPR
jgi:hypothetical protein